MHLVIIYVTAMALRQVSKYVKFYTDSKASNSATKSILFSINIIN